MFSISGKRQGVLIFSRSIVLADLIFIPKVKNMLSQKIYFFILKVKLIKLGRNCHVPPAPGASITKTNVA